MSDNLEPRIKNVEEAMQILTQLALRADERMDATDQRLDEFDKKVEELAESQKEFAESQKQLIEAQKQTEANLSALTIIMADLGRAQAHTERTLAALTEKFDRYISGT